MCAACLCWCWERAQHNLALLSGCSEMEERQVRENKCENGRIAVVGCGDENELNFLPRECGGDKTFADRCSIKSLSSTFFSLRFSFLKIFIFFFPRRFNWESPTDGLMHQICCCCCRKCLDLAKNGTHSISRMQTWEKVWGDWWNNLKMQCLHSLKWTAVSDEARGCVEVQSEGELEHKLFDAVIEWLGERNVSGGKDNFMKATAASLFACCATM